MIKPLLEGFDPARRPLLFLRGIWACCGCQRRVELIVQIWQWATSGSAICVHCAKKAKIAPGCLRSLRSCGAVRHDCAFRHARKLHGEPPRRERH
jgi:hypothetical protein